MVQAFKPKAYLKTTCPSSFKFYLFLAESGILKNFKIIRCNPEEHAEFEEMGAFLSKSTGKDPVFPIVEYHPGEYLSDSDRLIDYYSMREGVSEVGMPALQYYRNEFFPFVVENVQDKPQEEPHLKAI